MTACSLKGAAEECIYAFGGFYGGSDSEINDSIEKYSPAENAWNKLMITLKTPLWACTAIPIS